MRNPMTRLTEEKILRKIVEIRDIMDKECPDYAMLDINIQPDYMSFFTASSSGVDYALPNLSLHDRREDGENFCSYIDADGSTHNEDVDDMIARTRLATHPGIMREKLGI